MLNINLQQLIGETTEYDKKEAVELHRPKSWLKSVSAFANGGGGMLIFGVRDDNTVVGIQDIKTASEKISECIKARLAPIPIVNLNPSSDEGIEPEKPTPTVEQKETLTRKTTGRGFAQPKEKEKDFRSRA